MSKLTSNKIRFKKNLLPLNNVKILISQKDKKLNDSMPNGDIMSFSTLLVGLCKLENEILKKSQNDKKSHF